MQDHDPKGKIKTTLKDDVFGGALMHGDNNEYRPLLWRLGKQHEYNESPYVVWIGMNPSTADGQNDDPTCRKERMYTSRTFAKDDPYYMKCNVMDYRATSPKDLLLPGVKPCSNINLHAILDVACRGRCIEIIMCYGAIPGVLRPHAFEVIRMLTFDLGRELKCLGQNKDGSPKHPLYLRNDTPLQDFEPRTVDGYTEWWAAEQWRRDHDKR